jgi:hypothetical protein
VTVEALPYIAADSKNSKEDVPGNYISSLSSFRVVISDGGSHFTDKTFRKWFSELGVDHRIATPY